VTARLPEQRHRVSQGAAASRQAECAIGTVVATGPGQATVSVEAAVACERCATGRGCGAALPGRRRRRQLQVNVPDGLDLQPGDMVRLGVQPGTLLRAAWLAYGLPLSAMVAAVAAGSASVESEAGAVALAAMGLAIGAAAARRQLRGERGMRRFVPVALERRAGLVARRRQDLGY
jgi:sigma-E factor negative regulatory protein RseC